MAARPASATAKRRAALNVSTLLHREKEWLAEEVLSLTTRLRDVEEAHRRQLSENRRLDVEKRKVEAQLIEREKHPGRTFNPAATRTKAAGTEPSSSSLVRSLKERVRHLQGINADLEAELIKVKASSRSARVGELEAENAAYLSEVLRLTKLTQRRATEATERNLSSCDGLWDSDSDLPIGGSSSSRPSSRPASAASRRREHCNGGPGEAFKHAASIYLEPHVMEKGSHRLARDTQEIKDVKRRLSNLGSAHRALQQQAVALRENLAQREAELAKAQSSQASQRVAAKAKQRIQELTHQLATTQAELEQMKAAPALPPQPAPDPKHMKTLQKRQDWLEEQMRDLQEDCDRLSEERAHLKRQSVLEKQAQQHLAQELMLQNAELSRARDQVRRLQRERDMQTAAVTKHAPISQPPPQDPPRVDAPMCPQTSFSQPAFKSRQESNKPSLVHNGALSDAAGPSLPLSPRVPPGVDPALRPSQAQAPQVSLNKPNNESTSSSNVKQTIPTPPTNLSNAIDHSENIATTTDHTHENASASDVSAKESTPSLCMPQPATDAQPLPAAGPPRNEEVPPCATASTLLTTSDPAAPSNSALAISLTHTPETPQPASNASRLDAPDPSPCDSSAIEVEGSLSDPQSAPALFPVRASPPLEPPGMNPLLTPATEPSGRTLKGNLHSESSVDTGNEPCSASAADSPLQASPPPKGVASGGAAYDDGQVAPTSHIPEAIGPEASEPAVDPSTEPAAPSAATSLGAAVPGGCSEDDTADEDEGGELFVPPALGSESDEPEPDPESTADNLFDDNDEGNDLDFGNLELEDSFVGSLPDELDMSD